jgi:hypothetical protein
MSNFTKFFLMSLFVLLTAATQVMGQSKTITGEVVDAKNEGMPGVNVQVKGKTSGSITDVNGHFSISVPDSKATLLFKFIGYADQEIKVGNQSHIKVVLQENTQSLDEVVVVAYVRHVKRI